MTKNGVFLCLTVHDCRQRELRVPAIHRQSTYHLRRRVPTSWLFWWWSVQPMQLAFFNLRAYSVWNILPEYLKRLTLNFKRYIKRFLSGFYAPQLIPPGTAEARISYGNSVCPSVRQSVRLSRPGGIPSTGEIETPGLHHMVAWSI